MASYISALAQEVKVAEWEEVFYNQPTHWSNNYQEFDVSQIVIIYPLAEAKGY